MYDRDWYRDKKEQERVKASRYDPKQFRNGTNGGYVPPPYPRPLYNKLPPNLIRTIGGWLLLLLVLYFILSPLVKKSRQVSGKADWASAHSPLASQPVCSPNTLPPNGATQIADPSRMRRTDVLFSGLEIENKQKDAYLTDLSTGQRIMGTIAELVHLCDRAGIDSPRPAG